VYEGTTLRPDLFEKYLEHEGIRWPRSANGKLRLDADTFKERARAHGQLEPLRQLRKSVGELRMNNLTVGRDGRNRTLLSPFGSVTGRNQPSSSKSIFGPSRWIRSLIRPEPGHGLAYIDYSSQEIGIAAALSGDAMLAEAYRSGDPYLAFAKSARLAPADATKSSHMAVRERCKAIVLGVNYGMGSASLALSAGVAEVEARELLEQHRRTYRRFWEWLQDRVDGAMLRGHIDTVFGWRMHVGPDQNPRSLMNFPMQANGAEILRLACIAGTEAGIEICAPVHDAVLIHAPLERLDPSSTLCADAHVLTR
jgi:DNA polymerase I